MNPRLRTSLVVLFALAVLGTTASVAQRRPAPPFAGTSLPQPPRQGQPWTPPKTTLPEALLTATAALFKAGLADPRGGEYRVIEVGTGSCWAGDAGVVRTHGWVLPAGKGEKQRFAIAWNGLVYPVVSIGAPANLRADVRAAVAADDKMRAARGEGFYRFRHAWSEGHSVAHSTLLPVKSCLLLRLGEEELARQVWDAWTAGMRADTNDDDVHLRDPYLMLATDWTWALFDRAVCAHMRADDRLALADLRALIRIAKTVRAEGERRGFRGRDRQPLLPFLDQLPDLLADQERRAQKKPVPIDKGVPPRIAALIRDLENTAARQWGQPGGVSLADDGTVRALIEEGDAAVEPLLKCLEADQRLTRSVQFGRDFHHYREVLGVHRAAYRALTEILKTSAFVAPTVDTLTLRGAGRKQVVAAVRAYWKKFGTLPREERWLAVLADDRAGREQWLQAADNIANLPRGTSLRGRTGPSITELFIRRIDALSRGGEAGSDRLYRLFDACRLVDLLVRWDERPALAVLRKQMKVCRDYLGSEGKGNTNAFSCLGPAIARFTQRRLAGRDRDALDEYAAWVRTLGPNDMSHSFRSLLAPMWENPGHPAIAAAAEAMFTNAASPWTKRFLRAFNTHDLADTPMVGLAGFRKRLLVELADTRPAGKLKLSEAGYGSIELTGAYSGGRSIHTAGDPRAPKLPAEVAFRVCDYYAWQLSWLEGVPRCELYWPAADRDRAVAACIAFLKQYGERFAYSPAVMQLPDGNSREQARLIFPRLDRPASAEEARQGRAIFALTGADKVRLARTPPLPLRARWLAHKGAVRIIQGWDTRQNRAIYRAEPDRDGLVWQAEEVWKDGRWQRYYGFVGRHAVVKVPAAEVEFLAANGEWAELSGGIDCRVSGLPDRACLALGEALTVQVQLRNRAGVARAVPGEFVRPGPGGGLALHAGVRPRLWHAAKPGEKADWREISPRAAAHFLPERAVTPAPPGEEFARFAIDLRGWFDITRPGAYRLQIAFSRRDRGFADGESQEVLFSVE